MNFFDDIMISWLVKELFALYGMSLLMYFQASTTGPYIEILNPVHTIHPISVTLVLVYAVIFA